METIYKSITDYALDQARNGVRVLPGNKGTYWAGYEFGAMMPIRHFISLNQLVMSFGVSFGEGELR